MRASGLLLGLLLFVSTASAQDEAPPSMALLEFLGEWGDEDAAWIERELNGAMVLAADADEARKVQSNEESKDDE